MRWKASTAPTTDSPTNEPTPAINPKHPSSSSTSPIQSRVACFVATQQSQTHGMYLFSLCMP